MGFRETVSTGTSLERRVSALKSLKGGLPEGFSWQESINFEGLPTLVIVHDVSGRIVFQGF